jgi:hypothetical protein
MARTGSAGTDDFVFGFALAKELKRLPFCFAGAALPEGFEDAWECCLFYINFFCSSLILFY